MRKHLYKIITMSRKRQRNYKPSIRGGQARRAGYTTQYRSDRRMDQMSQKRAALDLLNSRTAGFLGLENKFYDTANIQNLIATAVMDNGEVDPISVLCLSAPAQGDGESNRDGRKIVVSSIFVTGIILTPNEANQTGMNNGATYFIALVQDKQTNGAQLNSEDVYTNPSNSQFLVGNPLRNLEYTSRFRVLAIESIIINTDAATYDGTNIEQAGKTIPFTLSKKLQMPVTFNGTTAGVANVVDNSLHLVCFTSATSDPSAQIYYNSRIRFTG